MLRPGHTLITAAAIPLVGGAAIAQGGPPPTDDHANVCTMATPWPIGGGGGGGGPPDPAGELIGRLEVPGDVDWFELRLQPSHLYRFDPWTLDCGICPRARVFATDCFTEIARIAPFETPKAYWFLAPPSGRLLAAVDSPAGMTGAYTVPIDLIGGPFQDDHPSTIADAAPLNADGQIVSGTLEFGMDADVFVLAARPGALYRLDVLSGLGDPNGLTLTFGPLGAESAIPAGATIPDAACALRPEGCATPRLIAPVGDPSLMYLWIQHRAREREDLPPRSYQFRLVDEGDFTATPGSQDCGAVPPISLGVPVQTQLANQSFSFQFWEFPVEAGHTYRVRLDATIGPADLAFGVTDADCLETLVFNDAAFGRFTAYFVAPDSLPKRLLLERTMLRIDPLGRPIPAWCILRVDDLGVVIDPEPDYFDAALPLAIGGRITEGTIGYGGDIDWFTGGLTPGVSYRAELRVCTAGGDAGVIARVIPGAGATSTLLAMRDSGQPLAWVGQPIASSSGPLYIQVERALTGETPLRYELRIVRADCRADWDGSGARDQADLFAYLADYFGNHGEFDDLGETPGVGDLLAFLQAWMGGCP